MGRITLAKSTVTTLASYTMQTAKLPRNVCDTIDKKTRRFVWGGDEEKRKIHLLSWECLQKPMDQGGLALRSARQTNAAFLTKLGWRVLTEPNALWSRVLRSKYCKGRCDLDMFERKANMSNVWRGITDNVNTLVLGARVAVNNGSSTLFWDHRWATNLKLRDLALHDIPPDLDGATVEELWDPNAGWKWDAFANLLPPDVIKEIDAHELKSDPSTGDLLYWCSGNKGKFSIKSALNIIRRDELEPSDGCWELIWKLRVQQRIRVFIWLAMHDRLMTNSNRHKRNLTDIPRCSLCEDADETVMHVLRDCKAAKEVWRQVGGPAHSPSFRTGNLRQWLTRNIKFKQEMTSLRKLNWPIFFAIVIWWLWRWRNCVALGTTQSLPIDVNAFLMTRFEEAWRSLGDSVLESNVNPNPRVESFVRWKAPPEGWMVLNSDGAAKGSPGPAGGRGYPK